MKIGFISDIHLDLLENQDVFLKIFYKEIKLKKLDVLVIAGDISENALVTKQHIKDFKKTLGIPVFYVPGNHDMWHKHNKLTTDNIYDIFLNDDNCLSGKIIEIKENVFLLGDVFWYDYSFGNYDRFSKKDFIDKTYDNRTWQDYFFANWLVADEEKCAEFINNTENLLNKINNEDRKIILVSHMINHKEFRVPDLQYENFSFFNAFLGSESINKMINKHNIDIAVCGHVHYRKRFEENGTNYICSCLGYEKEWQLFDDTSNEASYHIQQALTIVEV